MDEENLLETPLDKVEPYGLFKQVFLSMAPFLCSSVDSADSYYQTSNKNNPSYTKT